MLSFQSTQQLLRALGAHHLSLFMGNRLGYLLMQLLGIRVGGLLLLTSYSTLAACPGCQGLSQESLGVLEVLLQ